MNHEELCERGRRWLSGTRRCNPVFSNIASCSEIPDAIGWSSTYSWQGSTVLECKTSVGDFYADKQKRFMWQSKEHPNWRLNMDRIARKKAAEEGWTLIEMPMMGDYRFYFCESGIVSVALVEEHAPDHGLIWRDGRAMRIMRPAPKRTLVDKDGEIRFLRFSIINGKKPYERPEETPAPKLFDEKRESMV